MKYILTAILALLIIAPVADAAKPLDIQVLEGRQQLYERLLSRPHIHRRIRRSMERELVRIKKVLERHATPRKPAPKNTEPSQAPAPDPIEPTAPTLVPDTSLSFETVFTGYGSVTEENGTVSLAPMISTQPGETHSALSVSQKEIAGDYEITFDVTTHTQLRTGSAPNPWEVAWFAFGYNTDGMFKYLILKPNGYGIELGEFLGGTSQNFLWTSPVGAHDFPIGVTHAVRLRVESGRIKVSVHGTEYLTYTLSEKDRLDTSGKIGLYTEDASVTFANLIVTPL